MKTHPHHHSLRGTIPAHGGRRRPVWRKLITGIAVGAAGLLWLASLATTHAADLTASDGAVGDIFGISVSQLGSMGLVGAGGATVGSNSAQGAAYVFRNLDTASGTMTQNAKLTASVEDWSPPVIRRF